MDFSLTEGSKPTPPILLKPEKPPKLVEATEPQEKPKKRGRKSKVEKIEEKEPPAEKEGGRNPIWNPAEDDFQIVRELAELGWPSPKIAEALQVTPNQFAGALIRHPRLKVEFETGQNECKALPERRLAWRPMPRDVETVRFWAARGLGEVEIAAKLEVSRDCFQRRLVDTPQLKMALEQGQGEYRAALIEDSQNLLETRDADLKNVAGLLIFKLKVHCGLTDKQPEKVEGKIEHTHNVNVKLNAPKPVEVQSMSAFAEAEMARAKVLSDAKLAELTAAQQVIEVKPNG